MKRIVTFCALCALWGCRQVVEPSGEVIALSYSTSEQSKTDVLTSGDQISVFACMEGTEDCFLDNAKYVVGSDGRSLSTGSAVYYPDPKQAVRFFACFPYHTGTFSVPTDQSTALALKQADLCWAAVGSTPVASAVPLEFTHQMARLLITTNQPTTKIVAPNVFSGGTLHIRTGVFTNMLKSDISTTGNELIVPVQPLSRLVLTVSGVEYVFAPTAPINLTEAQTTTISLTLNSTTKTATLSGSSTTNWISSASEGNATQAVSNILTLHWPKGHPQSASANKIVLTIKDETSDITANYTVASGISYATSTFTIPFASAALHYPYTIISVAFYQTNTFLHESMNLIGGVIAKSGACVVGIRQPLNPPAASDYVKVGSLYWAKGNLVAVSKENNHECKVGAPTDYGLYFPFGSLIGWKGGALVNGGTGVGATPYTGLGTQSWGGAKACSWANDAMVWPSGMVGTPSAWPQGVATNQWYFGLRNEWNTAGQNIRDYPSFSTGGLANAGVGDPCSYYLGGTWRLPATADYKTLCNNQGGYGTEIGWVAAGGSCVTSPVVGGYLAGNKLFFPFAGCRYPADGLFNHVAGACYMWSSSVSSFVDGLMLYLGGAWVFSQYGNTRLLGISVRCVNSVAP